MNTTNPKYTIQHSLTQFSQGSLRKNALALLNTLGYQSERQVELSSNTFAGLAAIHPPMNQVRKDKALVDHWLSVDILFQLTGAELRQSHQLSLNFEDVRQVDNQIIESYLFMAIRLSEAEYSRSRLAEITREVNKCFAMPVMILFQYGEKITISIIHRRLNRRDESRDVLEKVTLIKDISISNPHRGHVETLYDLSLEQLAQKNPVNNFVQLHQAWEKTLDTAELNKKFYREVANWYFWAVKVVEFPEGAGADREQRNAISVIRLITRLIFVWFIKEKGLVPDDLFDERRLSALIHGLDEPDQSTYYKAILQNLFFATLNTEMNSGRRFRGKNHSGGLDPHHGITTVYRYQNLFKDSNAAGALFAGIPFLNGGLFECLDLREPGKDVFVDGFSDTVRNQPSVPNKLFFSQDQVENLNEAYGDTRHSRERVRGLIEIFKSYKFTIEENTPIEEEIALDPELLGRVFENLLAAYNPETKTTARKQTGSYYTPREIVNYMVDEALIAYLAGKLEGSENTEERLRCLLDYNNETNPFNEQETAALISAMDAIKVLDPACGSGAFPMGVLLKLVFILNKLDPGNQLWKQRQLDRAAEIPDVTARESAVQAIEQAFAENELDYGRKLYLIENCIYGVDIQPIAVQIAKLRFFISLVVDQTMNAGQENLGIRPLPNLETKFVAANTLIGIDHPQQIMFRNPLIDEKEKRLAEVRSALFTARTPSAKRKYRALDQQLRTELTDLLKNDGWGSATAAQLASWDPYNQNASAGFFDPEWMFGIVDGFDIVIGNPPYVSYGLRDTQSLVEGEKSQLRLLYPNSAEYKISLYAIFMEKAIHLCKSSGFQIFIVPDSFLLGRYFSNIRKYILRTCEIQQIVLLPFSVFEATVGFSVIYLFKKELVISKDHKVNAKLANNKLDFSNTHLRSFSYHQSFWSTRIYNRFVLFFDEQTMQIVIKIESDADELGKFITLGSGLISRIGQKTIISSTQINKEWLPGIISGGEITQYTVQPRGYYIHYKKDLIKSGYENIDYFSNKLFIRQTGDSLICAFDDKGLLALNNVHIGNSTYGADTCKFIMALCNSKLMNFYYKSISLETGRAMAQTDIETIEKLPIKTKPNKIKLEIIELINAIIKNKGVNPSSNILSIKNEIDQLVYQLYDLTEEEIAIVEGREILPEENIVNPVNDEEETISTYIEEVDPPIIPPSDHSLYKCCLCGKLVNGFTKDEHAREVHPGKTVEWKKIRKPDG